MSKDQVTTLLNYWERIILNLSKAVERTITEVAIEKQKNDELRAMFAEALIWVDPLSAGEEKVAEWKKASGATEKTMADLVQPQEEIAQ